MRTWKIVIVCLSVVALLVLGGWLLLQERFRSPTANEWVYTSSEHGFSVRVPSRDWKQGTKPGATVAFHNPKDSAIAVLHVTKESKDVFVEKSVPTLRGLLLVGHEEFLTKPAYKEGNTAVENRYAYWQVKAKATDGSAVFVAHSLVWCETKELTVKVTFEAPLKMTSQTGSAAEWDYFEKAANLICLSAE